MTEPQNSPSRQELANQLIDLADGEQQKRSAERVPVPSAVTRPRVVGASLAVAIPILIAVLVGTFGGQVLESLFETKPPSSVAREQAQKTLDELVGEIESFRKDYDELPETLVEIGLPSRGEWKYAVFGKGQYRVQGNLYGQGVSFDSTRKASDR
jgi:hypothetical protein